MKKLILISLCLISVTAYAQKLPDYGFNKVRIADTDKTISAEIDPVSSNPTAKPALYYYWYGANTIHSTQGGYSGKLLNGQYNEFYLNKNLKEQGSFRKGLKDGVWKNWNADGILLTTTTWKNGVIPPEANHTFWKKVNIFKKKRNTSVPDSTKVN